MQMTTTTPITFIPQVPTYMAFSKCLTNVGVMSMRLTSAKAIANLTSITCWSLLNRFNLNVIHQSNHYVHIQHIISTISSHDRLTFFLLELNRRSALEIGELNGASRYVDVKHFVMLRRWPWPHVVEPMHNTLRTNHRRHQDRIHCHSSDWIVVH